MNGKVGYRENRNKRSRMKLIIKIAQKLKDKSLIIYKEFLMKMIAEYRPDVKRGTITTEA